MIGSEGTLGFLSRIDYRTRARSEHKASAFVVFADLDAACRAVSALKSAPVDAVELLDRASLESVKHKKGMPVDVDTLGPDATALLIEARGADAERSTRASPASIVAASERPSTLNGVHFTRDPIGFNTLLGHPQGHVPGGRRQSARRAPR